MIALSSVPVPSGEEPVAGAVKGRPFRFGVQAAVAADGAEWAALARRMEADGYATLHLCDHMGGQLGPLVAMASAAAATTTLRVGCLVFNNDLRHPAVLAKELATLDLLSGGRVEAGLGAGWFRRDYDELGLELDRPGIRISRLAEAVQIVKTVWSGGPASFHGVHYQVDGTGAGPTPVQSRIPLLLGGGGRRMLTLAAQEADIVGINQSLAAGVGSGPEVTEASRPARFLERIAWVREAAAGRWSDIELQSNLFVEITDDPAAAYERYGSSLGLSADEAAQLPCAAAGSVDEVCDLLEARRERFGFSYFVVAAGAAAAFAPVVARLAGR